MTSRVNYSLILASMLCLARAATPTCDPVTCVHDPSLDDMKQQLAQLGQAVAELKVILGQAVAELKVVLTAHGQLLTGQGQVMSDVKIQVGQLVASPCLTGCAGWTGSQSTTPPITASTPPGTTTPPSTPPVTIPPTNPTNFGSKDCADVQAGARRAMSGVYTLTGPGAGRPYQAYCDMTTSLGGWTVIQKRFDGSQIFYKTWSEYANGFGSVAGEYWLGNDLIAAVTSSKQYRLRVDLMDWEGVYRYAEYDDFVVGDASTKYKLVSLGGYSGNASDSLTYHLNMMFTTQDQHNDPNVGDNCAVISRGAWWYRTCVQSNLNGEYNNTVSGQGVDWVGWHGYTYSLKSSEMKIRPTAIVNFD